MSAHILRGWIMVPLVNVDFSESWWWAKYGDMAGRDRRRLLFERFGDVGLGEDNPKPLPPLVGYEYGHRFMSAFWGCKVVYQRDHAPAAIPLPDARRRMENIEVPDIDSSPVIQRAMQSARELKEQYGACKAEVMWGGPLNNAVSVFGDEILAVCVEAPDLARRVLQKMGEAVMAVHDRFVCVVNGVDPATARKGDWPLGDCPVCMISQKTYTDVVLPADQWYRSQFTGEFGLHHCGVFDKYVDAYKPLDPDWLDIGPGSDLRVARRAYPKAKISGYVDVSALSRMSQSQIDEFFKRTLADAAPVELLKHMSAADVGPEVSDETIRDLMTVHTRLKSGDTIPFSLL